jgi:hypothetical protein
MSRATTPIPISKGFTVENNNTAPRTGLGIPVGLHGANKAYILRIGVINVIPQFLRYSGQLYLPFGYRMRDK